MPKTKAQTIQVSTVNDVAGRLETRDRPARNPARPAEGLSHPSAGTYNCRVVADTGQPSMHASGAAIDIATAQSDYWVWAKGKGRKRHHPVPQPHPVGDCRDLRGGEVHLGRQVVSLRHHALRVSPGDVRLAAR
jgi:hypothetical protein